MENVPVTGYAAEGKALGRIDGKVIFIEGAVPGDTADVIITRNKKDWAEGKATTIKNSARKEFRLFAFILGYAAVVNGKCFLIKNNSNINSRKLTDAFKRIGKLYDVIMLPIIGSEKTTRYRNKLEFTFSNKKFLTPEPIKRISKMTLARWRIWLSCSTIV